MKVVMGVDIGGTDIKFGKFSNQKLILKEKIKTNKSDDGTHIMDEVYQKVDEMVGIDELVAIGIGIPGPVVDGTALGAHNLRWTKARNIRQEVYDHYQGRVVCTVLNDANAATLGEMEFGGGKGYRDFVFITIGTGIGGGIIINHHLIEGSTGSCGEVGHLRVETGNIRRCNCGLYDCVEQYASATGIVKTAIELRRGRETDLHKLDIITAKDVFDLAKAGDDVAMEVVYEMVDKLSTALSQIATVINPEAFVIGGGVSSAGEFLIHYLRKRFKELAFYSVRDVKFELAKLGNDAGIYGNEYYASLELENKH
ncbi:MAG: ROK family protein [Bacilli bacterium]|nr:ROK family protein [Bacilli bacterium]